MLSLDARKQEKEIVKRWLYEFKNTMGQYVPECKLTGTYSKISG